MTDVQKAKAKVKKMKTKMNAAEKRLKAAQRNGSEKQLALCEKHFKMWKNRYLRAMVDLKKAKEAAPSTMEKIKQTPVKKVATYSGLAVLVTAAAVAGAIIIGKNRENNSEGQPATDSM